MRRRRWKPIARPYYPQPRRRRPFGVLLLPLAVPALLLIASALACNVSAPPPPTIPARLPTSTPQATIGISTLVPLALPAGVQAEAPADPGVEALLRQVDTDQLMLHVATLQGFETRHVNSTQTSSTRGIGAARQYIHDMLLSYNDRSQGRLTVWEHPFTLTWGEMETLQHNEVAILQGMAQGAGVIVVGAHYDSITTDWTNGEVYAPGANDNGSGVAALLEMARIMTPLPHRATIIFVAFSAEETGRQGSIRFVDEWVRPNFGDQLRAFISLDIVGGVTGTNGEINDSQVRLYSAEPNDSPSRQLGRAVNLIASTYVPDLQVVVEPALDRQGRWGDHESFSSLGYAAIRLVQAVEDRNRNHNAQDTVDGISPPYLTNVTRVALSALAVLADGLPSPTNITLRTDPANPDSTTLVWSPVEGAAGYVIALRQPGALTFNQVLTVEGVNSLTWSGFTPARFEAVAIAAIDSSGRWGAFSREYAIASR